MDDMYLHVEHFVLGFHSRAVSPRRCRIPRKRDELQFMANLLAIFALVTWRSYLGWEELGAVSVNLTQTQSPPPFHYQARAHGLLGRWLGEELGQALLARAGARG